MNPYAIAVAAAGAVWLWLKSKTDPGTGTGTDDGTVPDGTGVLPQGPVIGGLDSIFKPTIPLIPATSVDPVEPDDDEPWNDDDLDMDDDDDTPPQPYGAPPNVSGDPAGYNTDLYDTHTDVRKGLKFLGYVESLENTAPPAQAVRNFQEDYNSASIEGLWDVTGYLNEDSIPGALTLRALEIAVSGTDGLGLDDIVRGFNWSEEFGT